MKRMIILAAMICVLSCSKEEVTITGKLVEKSFTASFEEPTKTSIDVTGKVDWSKDDVINYYTASNGTISTYEIPISGHSISFTASVGSDDSFIIAAYGGTISSPQAKSMTLIGAVPSVQSGKFEDAHVSVCKRYFENGNTLNFKNVTSLIKFSLTRADVSYITFTADDGTKIHGNGSLYFSFSEESISSVKFSDSEGGNSIRVNTNGAGNFYISTLPCSIKGFTVLLYDTNNKVLGTVSSSNNLTLNSGKIVNLGFLDSRVQETTVETVMLNHTQLQINPDKQFLLLTSISPYDAVVHTETWSSDNESIASVSANGMVTAKSLGTCKITVTVNESKYATCIINVVDAIDLCAYGTANCYVADNSGWSYKFKASVKGNSTESVGSIKTAKVLWESYGTDQMPTTGDIISSVSLDGEYIYFTSGANGNALIAVKDIDGDILWSWHIWVCDGFDMNATAQVYNNNAGTMMDRNLGATSADPGDIHSLGLLYQWGRKDPFLGANSIYFANYDDRKSAKSTGVWADPVVSTNITGTIAYSILNPMQFISKNEDNYDWLYTGDTSCDNSRWQTEDKQKGLYDPCPQGWRIPNGGVNGVWAMALGTTSNWTNASNWDSMNKGMDFGKTDRTMCTGTVWYPASGYLWHSDGQISNSGVDGFYWSCTKYGYPYPNYIYMIDLFKDGTISIADAVCRAYGFAVRCKKEE